MKQVLQNLKTGVVEVAEIPCPLVRAGHLLVRTRASLISAGTERMLVEFGKGSLLAKARAQPEKVRQVLDKIRTDGLLPTLEAVFSRLDEPLPLGYCNAGEVVEVGEGVTGFQPGDRVISNGPHAEYVCVPKNLCARIPDNVTDESAAFTVLSSIGLQGIRLLNPTLGECVVVSGLGLIGLAAVQMLAAHGCRVLGIDLDPARLELARRFGAQTVNLGAGEDPVAAAAAFSGGAGVDGVLITASTKSNEVMRQAAAMCRKRGRIVLVGVVGLELNRSDFYKKELTFQVSCSYGPGRYDSEYEERGRDYPLPFVRWTEQRNFTAVLDLLASGRMDAAPLVSRRVAQAQAAEAYRALTDERDALGIILTYPVDSSSPTRSVSLKEATSAGGRTAARPEGRGSSPERRGSSETPVFIGLIGAGNFAKMTLLPALKSCPVRLRTIASAGGVSGVHAGRKFGFERATTDYRELLSDREINLVIITTRHDLHAAMTIEALAAGKHVAVEKPLCLNASELEQVRAAYEAANGRQLLVGFNRRFSPQAIKMKQLLAGRSQPMCMSMMVNAGVVSVESWVQDAAVGGGRIIGEGCHWIDLMAFLIGAPVVTVTATRIGDAPGVTVRDDKMTITLTFTDGSIGTLHYFGNGHKSYDKETLEVFCEGRVLRLENFRRLVGFGWSGFSKMRLRRQDKGHGEEFRRLTAAIASGDGPVMPFEEIDNVMRATFAAVESATSGRVISLPSVNV